MEVFGFPWHYFPAWTLMAVGGLVALVGTRREIVGLRMPWKHPGKALTFMVGFRISVIGLALMGIGAAWAWDILWLLVLSLAIGGEETLESTVHIYALTKGKDLRITYRR